MTQIHLDTWVRVALLVLALITGGVLVAAAAQVGRSARLFTPTRRRARTRSNPAIGTPADAGENQRTRSAPSAQRGGSV
jgi:hypothetical protein